MKKTFKALLSSILVLAMVVSTVAFGTPQAALAADEMEGQLVILHTNDMHGHYDEAEEGCLGIAAVAAAKEYYQSLGANVLLIDAGDFSQGTTLVSYYKGMSAIDFMNAAGYDVASLGNHEFDFGFDALLAMAEAANFPILDANIISKETGKPYFEANKIFEFGDMKVGVFGLDTAETQTKASPKNVQFVTFLDGEEMIQCAKDQVAELKAAGCTYIVCVGHLGLDDESVGRRSEDVMNAVEGIDLFIDGHSHTTLQNGKEVGSGLIVSTGTALANIGLVVYDGKTTVATLISTLKSPSVNELVGSKVAEVAAAYDKLFAKTVYELNGNRAPGVRTEETNLGDFAADAYRYAAQKYSDDYELGLTIDGAIQNGGGIRATIAAGDISMNTLKTVFPFGNSVSIVTITGAQLLEALEASCFACPDALGGFPQSSGIVFTINTGVPYAQGEQYPDSTYFAPAAPGSRVTIATVGGKAFDPKATYNISVNNFMADGGDTFYILGKASSRIDTEVLDSDALISYVESLNGVIGEEYKAPKGNITIVNEPAEVTVPETPADVPGAYTVVAGDTLRKIAEKVLGKASLWQKIYELNKDVISDPNVIQIGQVLQIPADHVPAPQ